jgi:16S rRNA (uracil1498-N3)-methyltransferase
MHRIIINQWITDDASVIRIDQPQEVHHALRVLRLSEGDQVELWDEHGREFVAEIISIQRDSYFEVKCIEMRDIKRESPVQVILFQGLPKQDKLEWIIQKAVELGAVKIVPVECERSVARIRDDKDAVKKAQRWNRIAYEAAKQSKRTIEPEVTRPVRIEQVKALSENSELKLAAYEDALQMPLRDVIQQAAHSVSIFIGPEGGLTENEIERLNTMGFKTVGLGPRILRTETAGMALLAIVQYVLGDMGGK